LNIGIIGGGSIGLLLSTYLSKNHQITLYVRRKEQKEIINNQGLLLVNGHQSVSVKAALTADINGEDSLIVCVKQPHLPSLLPILNKLNKNTPIIFLQNGMGHTEQIKHINQPLLLGVIDHGALKMDDRTVCHTGKGMIRLAAFHKTGERIADNLAQALNQTDFPIQRKNDWYQLLVEKLIVNAVINPVTALFDVENGEIIRNPYIYKIAKEICRETANVLALDFNEEWIRVQYVAEKTSKNISSMLKDVKENRKTELEGITGFIIENSNNHEIPYTIFVYNSIKAIEVKKGITD